LYPADETAWRGAGASVLFAAAIWVALLFTTSVITLSANYLNGADSSVGGLRTTVVDEEADSKSAMAELPLVAAGQVVIHGANILVKEGGDIVVRRGSVTVDSLYRRMSDGEEVAVSSQGLRDEALWIPSKLEGKVAFKDSCIYRAKAAGIDDKGDPSSCTGLSATKRPHSGTLPALSGGGRLKLGSAQRAVGITNTSLPQATLTLPQVLIWAPLGQLAWLILAGAIAVICWLRLRSKVTDPLTRHAQQDGIPREDWDACIRARMTAAFPHRGEQLVNLVGCVTVLVSIGIMLGSLTGEAPWQRPKLAWTDSVATLALWVSLGMALGLVWLASQLRTSESARKAVGILWDLTTFWPRAAHPLAPPCYAERVVPELLTRIKWALKSGDDGGGADLVILSGHSQGSTLLVAAASRLSDNDLEEIRLVTYGSQLRAWYGRIFPAVFGPDALGNVATDRAPTFGKARPDAPSDAVASPRPSLVFPGYTRDLEVAMSDHEDSLLRRLSRTGERPRWVNLFRRTDPIGFRVFSDIDHVGQDTYVLEVPTRAEGDPGPTVMTHGGYPHTIEYRETVAAWTGEELPAVSKPRIAKPPFHPQS
jgi:hypothetical protein